MIDIHMNVVLSDLIVAAHSILEYQAMVATAVKTRSTMLGSVTSASTISATEDVTDLVTVADQSADQDEVWHEFNSTNLSIDIRQP